MKRYRITLTGQTPLLMHQDNINHADDLKAWRQDPGNRGQSVAGDDRSPAFTWLGCVYHDGERLCIPAENIQRMCLDAAAGIIKSGKTSFKALSQSGMGCVEAFWPLSVRGREIPWASLDALRTVAEFGLHRAKAKDLGFQLFTKRATVGQNKHIRVRPRFDEWKVSGHIDVWDAQLTETVIRNIFTLGGREKGLGDWRPSSKRPGPFGRFEANVQSA